MKTTVTVIAEAEQQGIIPVRYQVEQKLSKMHTDIHYGVVRVQLSEQFSEDRAALSELAACNHLMHDTPFCEDGISGMSLSLNVSRGAIKKALNKGKLKADGKGSTTKQHVADFAHFLATRFFGAEVGVVRSFVTPEESETTYVSSLDFDIECDVAPDAKLFCLAIDDRLVISRHVMSRAVERVTAKNVFAAVTENEDLPDACWGQAWGFLRNFLCDKGTVELTNIPADVAEFNLKRHGVASRVLYQPKRGLVAIVVPGRNGGLAIATVYQEKQSDWFRGAYHEQVGSFRAAA